MVNSQQLQQETSEFLKKPILAVGIFDVSLKFGARILAPAAAGVATYMGTRLLEKKLGNGKKGGAKVAAAAAGVAGALGTKHLVNTKDAEKQGLTPIMICAVTKTKVYLLDWKGNHNKGHGPTRVLYEFHRNKAKIKNSKRGLHHHIIDVSEDGNSARIECNLGATHANKKMNREAIKFLTERQ